MIWQGYVYAGICRMCYSGCLNLSHAATRPVKGPTLSSVSINRPFSQSFFILWQCIFWLSDIRLKTRLNIYQAVHYKSTKWFMSHQKQYRGAWIVTGTFSLSKTSRQWCRERLAEKAAWKPLPSYFSKGYERDYASHVSILDLWISVLLCVKLW